MQNKNVLDFPKWNRKIPRLVLKNRWLRSISEPKEVPPPWFGFLLPQSFTRVKEGPSPICVLKRNVPKRQNCKTLWCSGTNNDTKGSHRDYRDTSNTDFFPFCCLSLIYVDDRYGPFRMKERRHIPAPCISPPLFVEWTFYILRLSLWWSDSCSYSRTFLFRCLLLFKP